MLVLHILGMSFDIVVNRDCPWWDNVVDYHLLLLMHEAGLRANVHLISVVSQQNNCESNFCCIAVFMYYVCLYSVWIYVLVCVSAASNVLSI